MILRRMVGRFSEVVPEWKGCTVVLIGCGPSLTLDQLAIVHSAKDVHSIAINDAYLWAPWADVHYAADAKWHRWHTTGIDMPLIGLTAQQVCESWRNFKGQKCSIQNSMDGIDDQNIHILKNKTFPDHGNGLSCDPAALVTGWHSGYQALNLAILSGAEKIILLGYDGRPSRKDGRRHWFGDHPTVSTDAVYESMRRAFSAGEKDIFATGVRVVNCSPDSAIDSFEKMDIKEALQ